MAITSDFNEERSRSEMAEKMKQIHERIIAAMQMAGETFIREARNQIQDHSAGTYLDQTTNLRNSVQYLIIFDGEVVNESESKFSSQNRILVSDLIKERGYQLIGIAGMNYASEVESRGYNVITWQRDQCIVDLTKYFQEIQKLADR